MKAILKALRILDEDNTLSLTNLYLFAGLGILFTGPVSPSTVAILTLILANTNLKKFSRFQKLKQENIHIEKLEAEKAKNVALTDEQAADLALVKNQVQNLLVNAQASNILNQFR